MIKGLYYYNNFAAKVGGKLSTHKFKHKSKIFKLTLFKAEF